MKSGSSPGGVGQPTKMATEYRVQTDTPGDATQGNNYQLPTALKEDSRPE